MANTANHKSFLTRRFEMADADGVVQLLEHAFRRQFSLQWWNWKYKSNPSGFWGDQGDIWIAEDTNGKVVGHWAVIPVKIKLGSEVVTVAQPVDAATHFDYRGLGIFKALMTKVCSEVGNRYRFIFGFPHENIHQHLLKFGWKDFPLVEFYKFLNYDRPLRSLLSRTHFVWSGKIVFKMLRTTKYFSPSIRLAKQTGRHVEIHKVERFPREIDDFWKLARDEYKVVLERTAAFLNWRFSKCLGDYEIYIARSSENGSIVGYLVLKRTETQNIRNVLKIVDLFALPHEDKCVLDLIKKALALGKNEGIDLIHCRIPYWHKYAKILHKLGFISVNRMFGWMKIYQPRLVLYHLSEEGDNPKMQEWFYTLADTDDQ